MLPTENPRVNLRTCEDEHQRRQAEGRRYSNVIFVGSTQRESGSTIVKPNYRSRRNAQATPTFASGHALRQLCRNEKEQVLNKARGQTR